MYFTGFADEAGDGIDTQIAATLELGWQHIEARNIDGLNITDIAAPDFERVYDRLQSAGIQIDCFGSAVANWAKDPRREADMEASLAELERAIPRMQRLGTRMLRGMSFMLVKDRPPDDPEIEKRVIRQIRRLVRRCEDAGIVYVHENCMTYGGQSPAHTLKLIAAADSEAFRLVFDTGNPVFSDLRLGDPPYRKQTPWDFYAQIKPFIAHVHIKDGRHLADTDDLFPEVEYTYPGEGDADVPRIIADLLNSGYDGGLSIEPHMHTAVHDADRRPQNSRRYQTYVEYGRRLMRLVAAIQQETATRP
jgi:sugar phosphate isomerase/epimerase